MKKNILLLLLFALSFKGFSQLACEGFEGTWPPTGWGIFQNEFGSNQIWTQSPLNQPPFEGSNAAFLQRENVSTGMPQDWLVTPIITVSQNAQLKFHSRLTIPGNQGSLYRILISTNSNQSNLGAYDLIEEWTEIEINPSQEDYNEIVVSIPEQYENQNIYVAFVMLGDNADRWLIDKVCLTEQCFDPINLSAQNITASAADLNWNDLNLAGQWEIEILEVNQSATGNGIMYSGNLPYNTTGLAPNTNYKFYVKSHCTSESESNWIGPFTFTTLLPGMTCNAPIVITALPFLTTDNTSNYGDHYFGSPGSGCSTVSDYLNGDDVVYAYTAPVNQVISLVLDNLTEVNAAIFVYTSCADIGQACYAGTFSNFTPGELSIQNLPVNQGITYYIVLSSSPWPQSFGYSFSIQVESCPAPSNVSIEDITTTSANLSWEENGTSTSWEYVLQAVGGGFPAASGNIVNAESTTLSNLIPSTQYEVYVRSVCGDGTSSAWEGPEVFNTTCTAFVAPFTESFNSNSSTEFCWSILDQDLNGNSWNIDYAVSAYEGDQCAILDTGFNAGTNDDWLISPTIVLTGNKRLRFFCKVENEWSPNEFEVLLSVSGNSLTDFTHEIVSLTTYSNGNYIEITANLVNELNTPFSGPVNLAWHVTPENSNGWRLYIDNIIIEDIPNCPDPTNLSAGNLNQDSAILSWDPGFIESSWEIVIQPIGTGVPAGNGTLVQGLPLHNAAGLLPATQYEFYVRGVCLNNELGNWIGPYNFMTTQVPVILDYSQTFEMSGSDWYLNNGLQQNIWVVGNAINNGSNALYISNDGGLNNSYNNTAPSVAHAFRDIQKPDLNDINLSFDWLGYGEYCCDYMRVWVVPVSFIPEAGEIITTSSGGIQLGGNLNMSPNFNTQNYVINSDVVPGEVVRIVFEWINDNSAGYSPAAAIDNILLSEITCSAVANLQCIGTSTTTASIQWEGILANASYDYYFSVTNSTPVETTIPSGNTVNPTVLLEDLQGSTIYYLWVRSSCGVADGNSFWTGPLEFTTLCNPFNIPFHEGFNSDSITENCWSIFNQNGDADKWNLNFYNDPYEGDQVAVIETDLNNGNNDDWLISPTLQLTGNQQLKYRYKVSSQFDPNDFEVLLSTTGVNIASFVNVIVPLAEYQNTEYVENIIEIDDFSGPVNIAFHVPSGGLDGWILYLDDITVQDIPTCPNPVNLLASDITTTTAELSWEPVGEESSWEVIVQLQGEGVPTVSGTLVADTTYTVNLLQPSTYYEFYVRAYCSDSDLSIWSGPHKFSTVCGVFTIPFYEGFNSDSLTEYCWIVNNQNGDDIEWNTNFDSNQFEGDQVAILYTDGNVGNNNDWLISPEVLLDGNQRLRFRYKVNELTEPNDMEVLLSATGTEPSSFINTIIPLTSYDNTQYIESITNLTGYSGPVRIAFHVPQGGLDGWILYIDKVIIENIPTCLEPSNLNISCITSTSAHVSWQPGDNEEIWEIAFTTLGDLPPASGTLLGETSYTLTNLTAETSYTVYVRAVCEGGDVGEWVQLNFTTPTISVMDADPFCASGSSDQYILFDNTWGDQNNSYGAIGCLYDSPNPVWYYLQVDNPGNLNFEIIQNTEFDSQGNPIGGGLDVDFVAYGPFNSLQQACSEIMMEQCFECPSNPNNPNFYPSGNIVDCSYSTAYIENFSIQNALENEIYAVLITNFNGQEGKIKLQQLPTSTGSTNCNILYNVSLGEDRTVCDVFSTTITATVTSSGGVGQQAVFEWFIDGQSFNPVIVSTESLSQTIEVNADATHTYSVNVSIPNALNTEPIYDEVIITSIPEIVLNNPTPYVVCDDESNDGYAEFNLPTKNNEILGSLDPVSFTVDFFITFDDAISGINAINSPSNFINQTQNNQTLYVKVSHVGSPCNAIIPLQLIVSPLPVTLLPTVHNSCQEQWVVLTGQATNYDVENASFMWHYNGAPFTDISGNTITVNEPGNYTLYVTYNGCTNEVSTELINIPTPTFNLGGPYLVCSHENIAVSIEDANFNMDDAIFQWTYNNTPLTDNDDSVDVIDFGIYTVTVTVGNICTNVQSIEIAQNNDPLIINLAHECINGLVKLTLSDSQGTILNPANYSIAWSGPAGFTSNHPEILPETVGLFEAIVISDDGCTGEIHFLVESTNCSIPKGISPNQDGSNDEFDLSAFNVVTLSIFNRYGQEVYTFNDYTNEWYGQDKNGNDLPTGTYFYHIEVKNAESRTGWVYVNRED